MGVYSTRTINREQAIEVLLEYKAEEGRKEVKHLQASKLDELLNYYATKFPDLYFLIDWEVSDV